MKRSAAARDAQQQLQEGTQAAVTTEHARYIAMWQRECFQQMDIEKVQGIRPQSGVGV